MRVYLLLAALVFSAPIVASPENRAVSTQLCDYWRYNFEVREYTCSFLGRRVNLVEAQNYRNTVSNLARKIEILERRVSELERQLELP